MSEETRRESTVSRPLIEATGLTKTFLVPDRPRATVREHVVEAFRPRAFRALHVLNGVDFELKRGESLGVMGRNGSGKSTLLKVLTGIYRPDGGHVVRRAQITPILELGIGWNPELDAVDNVYIVGAVIGAFTGRHPNGA